MRGYAAAVVYRYLWDPQGAAYMSPLGAGTRSFHSTTFFGTQKTLWIDAENACPTEPVANRHFHDAITSLGKEQKHQ